MLILGIANQIYCVSQPRLGITWKIHIRAGNSKHQLPLSRNWSQRWNLFAACQAVFSEYVYVKYIWRDTKEYDNIVSPRKETELRQGWERDVSPYAVLCLVSFEPHTCFGYSKLNTIKMLSVEKYSLLILVHLIPFTCHIALTRIAIIMLKSRGERGHPGPA